MNETPNSPAEPLIGMAPLVRMAFAGQDLTPLRDRLLARLQRNPEDANALMDLSTIQQLAFDRDSGLALQEHALQLCRHYRLPAKGKTGIRLLALMSPGALMDNAPFEFLLESSDVAIDMLYLSPQLTELPPLPACDLIYVAVGQSQANRPLLLKLQQLLQHCPQPVINAPARIVETSRDRAYALLHDAPGIVMPMSGHIDRQALARLAGNTTDVGSLLAGAGFPVIVRPIDSHAGHGLAKLDCPEDAADYLANSAEDAFHIAPFIDYRSADGLFRKYRIVLVDGRPYAGHMAISDHWMIHYLNAGMTENADKRRQEAAFMDHFEHDFARRHAAAFGAIHQRLGLDYLILDCGETRDGELLLFEIDVGAIIHDIDPVDIFPYKPAHMRKIFDAFHALLADRVRQGTQRTGGQGD